jgi:hypothetical protein
MAKWAIEDRRNGGESDQEESEAVENPGEGQDPNGRLHAEKRIPDDRCYEEDRPKNVKLEIVLEVLSSKERNLEAGSTKHLAHRKNDRVQRPSLDLTGHKDLQACHERTRGVVGNGACVVRSIEPRSRAVGMR